MGAPPQQTPIYGIPPNQAPVYGVPSQQAPYGAHPQYAPPPSYVVPETKNSYDNPYN